MKIRLLLAALCILALPMWFSTFEDDKVNNSAPFATVALAGHTLNGGYCSPCAITGPCLCDPGEEPSGLSVRPVTDDSPVKRGKAKSGRGFDLDFGAGAFLIGLALFMWSRFRA